MSSFSHVLEWLDENRRRAFPLKEHANNPDPELILDAALISNTTESASLTSVSKASSVCTFVTSAGTFTISLPISGTSITSIASNGSKLVVGSYVNTLPDGTVTYSDVRFEDSVTTNYTAAWRGVQSLSFIADDGSTLGPFTGDVDMVGRYYTDLSSKNSSLIWKVGKNSGLALGPCQSYRESDCGTQVSYINGISPVNNIFRITTGAGLALSSVDGALSLSVSFTEADICKAIPPTP